MFVFEQPFSDSLTRHQIYFGETEELGCLTDGIHPKAKALRRMFVLVMCLIR